jgi:hypothetical protein
MLSDVPSSLIVELNVLMGVAYQGEGGVALKADVSLLKGTLWMVEFPFSL